METADTLCLEGQLMETADTLCREGQLMETADTLCREGQLMETADTLCREGQLMETADTLCREGQLMRQLTHCVLRVNTRFYPTNCRLQWLLLQLERSQAPQTLSGSPPLYHCTACWPHSLCQFCFVGLFGSGFKPADTSSCQHVGGRQKI